MDDTEIVDVEKTKLNGDDQIADETEPAAEQTKKKRQRKKKNKTGVVDIHRQYNHHVFFCVFLGLGLGPGVT